MADSLSAAELLHRARLIYDDPTLPFAHAAGSQSWQQGFSSGADWMRLALEHIRATTLPPVSANFQFLGIFKYGLCSIGALLYLALIFAFQAWLLLPGVAIVFYAIEAQLVFLFPLALDSTPELFRASLAWTHRAGGTLRVMAVVMPIAVTMIFGGFVRRGFVRSWALGCLAVVLWYEHERLNKAA